MRRDCGIRPVEKQQIPVFGEPCPVWETANVNLALVCHRESYLRCPDALTGWFGLKYNHKLVQRLCASIKNVKISVISIALVALLASYLSQNLESLEM